jgi:hypothetical protein
MINPGSKQRQLNEQEMLNSLHAQKVDSALTLQILKIRKELIDFLKLLREL